MTSRAAIIICVLTALLVGCAGRAAKPDPQVRVGIDKLPPDAAKWAAERRTTQGLERKAFDLLDVYVIAAGEKRTGGYSVKIDGWTYTSAHGLVVNSVLVTPGPGQSVTEALTYPVAVFAVPKGMLVKVLFSDGEQPQALPVKGL